MNILCCYTLHNPYGRHVNIQDAVWDFLADMICSDHSVGFEQCDNNEEAYWAALSERWLIGRTFINLEHDVLPTEAQLQELWDCPEPWCAHEYQMGGPGCFGAGIGCTKFGAELLEAIPDCMIEVGKVWPGMHNALHGPRNWSQLDGRIYTVIRNRIGKTGPHVHGRVLHLNPYHDGAEYPRENASPGAPHYRSRMSG